MGRGSGPHYAGARQWRTWKVRDNSGMGGRALTLPELFVLLKLPRQNILWWTCTKEVEQSGQ